MKTKIFPAGYPKRLEKISWSSDDGTVAGPHKYHNRFLPYSSKGDSCFIKSVLLDMFYKEGIPAEVVNNYCQWLVDRISVYYTEDTGAFTVKDKRNKETKKSMLDIKEYIEMTKKELGYEPNEAKTMLNVALRYLKNFYDGLCPHLTKKGK